MGYSFLRQEENIIFFLLFAIFCLIANNLREVDLIKHSLMKKLQSFLVVNMTLPYLMLSLLSLYTLIFDCL